MAFPVGAARCGQARTPSAGAQHGFTLVELMVTVAVAAIGLTFAVAGFSRIAASNRLTTTANLLVASIRLAQLEAIKRNVTSQFCANTSAKNTTDTLGSACATQLGAVYWIDASNVTTQLQGALTLPNNITVGDGSGSTTAVTALRFSGNGLSTSATALGTPYTGLVADIYASNAKTNNHRCIYMATGSQLSVCTATGTAAACPTNEPTTASACQQ
jgi:type IV fimbrial biogenesis protein FimT